ncbi:prolyl oligopeptidase family serine peptidase [Kiritimatiellota bacterium B12222]|nr:prolyl oligopeptidase family serine peptidase [Kiritimatiellota bacterium B12222]
MDVSNPSLMLQGSDYNPEQKPNDPAILDMKAGQFEGEVLMPYRLFEPEGTSSENRLPLVVCLHGAGARGTDNVKPMSLFETFWNPDRQAQHPCFVLAPQMNRSWAPDIGAFINYSSTAHPATDEMRCLLTGVETILKTHPIDPDRVYLVGQSMGGFGTWDALARQPNRWAAAVPICGGGDPDAAAKFAQIPIWAWHGNLDDTVCVENTRELIAAIRQAGGHPRYTELPVKHGSWNNAFAEKTLYSWLFQQTRKTKATS